MSIYIVSIVSRNTYIIEIAAIIITSDSALKALKASLTTLINKGKARGLKGVVNG